MNRLQFFKWIAKGIAAVAVAPLAKYLPEAAPTPVLPQIQPGAKFFCISTPRSKSNWFYEAVKNGRVSAHVPHPAYWTETEWHKACGYEVVDTPLTVGRWENLSMPKGDE